jgi:hypothetical protein
LTIPAGGPIILLTDGNGHVGGRLIPLLDSRRVTLRYPARDPERTNAALMITVNGTSIAWKTGRGDDEIP